MNDNDIIKALECCISDKCRECPLRNIPKLRGCMKLTENALNLINRQKAENESLGESVRLQAEMLYDARAKAIREFAERLKEDLKNSTLWGLVSFDRIDNLVKEMTEENK